MSGSPTLRRRSRLLPRLLPSLPVIPNRFGRVQQVILGDAVADALDDASHGRDVVTIRFVVAEAIEPPPLLVLGPLRGLAVAVVAQDHEHDRDDDQGEDADGDRQVHRREPVVDVTGADQGRRGRHAKGGLGHGLLLLGRGREEHRLLLMPEGRGAVAVARPLRQPLVRAPPVG